MSVSTEEKHTVVKAVDGAEAAEVVHCAEAAAENVTEDVTEDGREAFPENVSRETSTAVKNQDNGGKSGEEDCESFGSCTVERLYGICEKFPGENVISDIGSEAFRIFSLGKKGSPEKIYSEFLGLKKAFSASAKEQPAPVPPSVTTREADTRSHSGFGSGNPYRDVSVGLTKRQMQIARESGMSFREYEELLNSVPGAKRLR